MQCISEQVKELLALAPEREQCLSVATFGASREEPRTCQVVQVGVRMRDGFAVIALRSPDDLGAVGQPTSHRQCRDTSSPSVTGPRRLLRW